MRRPAPRRCPTPGSARGWPGTSPLGERGRAVLLPSTCLVPAGPARAVVIAGPSPVTQGGATLSERECRDQDWYGIGADDGYDGAPASQIDAHRAACAEFGIEPDSEQYEAG